MRIGVTVLLVLFFSPLSKTLPELPSSSSLTLTLDLFWRFFWGKPNVGMFYLSTEKQPMKSRAVALVYIFYLSTETVPQQFWVMLPIYHLKKESKRAATLFAWPLENLAWKMRLWICCFNLYLVSTTCVCVAYKNVCLQVLILNERWYHPVILICPKMKWSRFGKLLGTASCSV